MLINQNDFKKSFKSELLFIGVSKDKAEDFINNKLTIKDLGFCNSIAIAFDDILQKKHRGYNGLFLKDTMKDIWEYNQKSLNEARTS